MLLVKMGGGDFDIDAIADDLDMNQGGGCGKGGQSPLPVSNGSPHIRIQKCLIGLFFVCITAKSQIVLNKIIELRAFLIGFPLHIEVFIKPTLN